MQTPPALGIDDLSSGDVPPDRSEDKMDDRASDVVPPELEDDGMDSRDKTLAVWIFCSFPVVAFNF